MESEGRHVVVIPHPITGHIAPLLHLSKALAAFHGFSVSLLLTNNAIARAFPSATPPSHPRLAFVGVSDGLPPQHPRRSIFLDAYEAVLGMRPAVEELLHKFIQENRSPTCIISDLFIVWSHDVSSIFGIPRLAFSTINAAATSVMSYTASLHSRGILPFKDDTSKICEELITCIPGVMPLAPKDIPQSMTFPSDHYRFQFVLKQFESIDKAAGLLVNTFYELEKKAIDEAPFSIPVYAIGPTLLLNKKSLIPLDMELKLWPEDTRCLQWLETQAASSVLYVSFGSMASMSADQVRELAFGLESSNCAFLWVIRPDAVTGTTTSVLPEEFFQRIKDRALVIDWAPQLAVLSHPSVAGFMSHCGWNSTFENLSLRGLPMICWPCMAEQRMNCRLIVDIWGMGLEMKTCQEDDMVHREEVERVVRELMQGEGGRRARSRAEMWKDAAEAAVADGGSSRKNLEACLKKVIDESALPKIH